jgi:phage terminase small subunit
MPRARDPNRDKAFEIWESHNGEITNRAIAEELDVPEKTISAWKSRDKWNVVLQKKECSTTNDKPTKKARSPSEAYKKEPVVESDELTDKQRAFCMYYVRSLNATSAYKKAYKCNYETAMASGSRLLRNVKVKATIEKMKRDRLEQEDLDKTDILQKYKAIAFADITDFIDFTQVEAEATETEVEFNPDGSKKLEKTEVVPYTYTKFAMHHSDEIDGTLITEISKGKDGMFKVKLADKMRALEFLSKYTDLLSEKEFKQLRLEKIKAETERIKAESKTLGKGREKEPLVIEIDYGDDDE